VIRKKKKPKVIVFVEGSNIYFAQKKMGRWLDWVKVKRFLKKEYEVLEIRYYVGVRKYDRKMQSFLRKLKRVGFKVRTKPVKLITDETGRQIEKANFDVEITADALEYTDKIDILILFSGDSDFAYLADLLHKWGKKVYAFSSRKTLSWELKLKADRHFVLEKLPHLTKKKRFVRI
jgi:uncharacterized LabA/DUF88 family protein